MVGYEILSRRFIANSYVMKLTTKSRYAVTALVDITMHQYPSMPSTYWTGSENIQKLRSPTLLHPSNTTSAVPVTIAEIAARHGISTHYLERLAGLMRAKGLLKSIRGTKGGYVLAKEPEQITVADIMDAVEEEMDATRCQGKANCHKGGVCLTHSLWEQLNQHVFQFLHSITLSTLTKGPAFALPIIERESNESSIIF